MQHLRRVPLLLLALLLLLPRPAAAQEFLANQIEKLISTDTIALDIQGLSGAFSGNLRIESVAVSDPKGVFLTARDLALDWSPLALVRANVEVEALTAGQIVLERLPEGAPADPDAPAAGGVSLPAITANIQKIAVGEFVLGESIAGVRARLSAEAHLVLQDDPVRLEVGATVDRLDQPGRIAANVVFAPADNRLEIGVKAGEPAGGLVATLLKLPGAPPVELTIDGQGPLSDFSATGALQVGGESAATLTARVTDTADGRRIGAALGVAAERFAPEAYAPYVRGGAKLDAEVLLRPDGTILIDAARLSSDSAALSLAGTYDGAGAGNALQLSLEGRNGAAIPLGFGAGGSRTAIDVASLKGTLSGALSAAALDLAATLPRAGFGPYAANGVDAHLTSPGFDVAGLAGPFRLEADRKSVV